MTFLADALYIAAAILRHPFCGLVIDLDMRTTVTLKSSIKRNPGDGVPL